MSVASLLEQSRTDRETWRHTSLWPYAETVFAAPPARAFVTAPAPLAFARVVFVNGRYRADLSSLPALPEAFFSQDETGLCWMEVGAQTCLALQPLEILFLNVADADPWENEVGLRLSLGANSRLTLIERHICDGEGLFALLPHFEISLAEQAKLVHGKIVSGGAGLHVSRARVNVAAGAFYEHFSLIADGGLTRCETDVFLTGELAAANVSGAALLRGRSHGDALVRVHHAAPHGQSRQTFRAVLDEAARGVFQGKIYVAPEAQKTDGHQLSRALLLSDKAEMDATPELEIYADDVKCSHGSAIGDLDERELFYLRSRGIGEKEARALLIEAFVNEGIEKIGAEEIAAAARTEVGQWLKI